MISRMRSRLTDDMLSACINIISINGPSFGTGMFSYRSKSSQHGYAPLQRKDGSRDLTKKRYNAIIYTTFMNRILILPINVKIAALKKLGKKATLTHLSPPFVLVEFHLIFGRKEMLMERLRPL